MKNNVIPMNIDKIYCNIHLYGTITSESNVPLFIMPVTGDMDELIEEQHMHLDPLIKSGELPPYVLVTFEVKNWNDDLSPWPAPAIERKQPKFGGCSAKTLRRIQDELIPEVTVHLPNVKNGPKGLIGYSMAGMFALWAMCQTDIFSVFASCSGSLWYDGFCDYIINHAPVSECFVYISLGEREELSRNPRFAKVGSSTRKIVSFLKASAMCKEAELVWHPGGHGGSVGERLAAAQLWMLKLIQGNGIRLH